MVELRIIEICELNEFTLHLLRIHNIKRVGDFLQTHFMKLSRICNLPVKSIWSIKRKLQEYYAPKIVKNMPKINELENMFPLINTGIESLDELLFLAADTSEFVMELCGSAGVGKSLLSQTICINFCINNHNSHILYIDTKNDFNASNIMKKLQYYWNYNNLHDIGNIMKNIFIENVYSLQNIVEILQKLYLHEINKNKNHNHHQVQQQQIPDEHNNQHTTNIRLVIIDSLSALWFMHERTFSNVNYWLTKLSQVVHQLNRSHGIAFILINLTLSQQQQNNKIKPAMGRFWARLPQIRLSMKLPQDDGELRKNGRIMTLEKCPYNETGTECLLHIVENGVFI